MKAVYKIIRHTMCSWAPLAAWGFFAFLGGIRGENFPIGLYIGMMGLMSINFLVEQRAWERTLRLLPVDGRMLILGRYLCNILVAALTGAVFALGCFLGKNQKFLVEIPMIMACVIAIGAICLPLQYAFQDQRKQWGWSLTVGILSAFGCRSLMEREVEFAYAGEKLSRVTIHPVPFGKGMAALAIALAAAALSWYISCRLDADREW